MWTLENEQLKRELERWKIEWMNNIMNEQLNRRWTMVDKTWER